MFPTLTPLTHFPNVKQVGSETWVQMCVIFLKNFKNMTTLMDTKILIFLIFKDQKWPLVFLIVKKIANVKGGSGERVKVTTPKIPIPPPQTKKK
jgi:hypothetical protein